MSNMNMSPVGLRVDTAVRLKPGSAEKKSAFSLFSARAKQIVPYLDEGTGGKSTPFNKSVASTPLRADSPTAESAQNIALSTMVSALMTKVSEQQKRIDEQNAAAVSLVREAEIFMDQQAEADKKTIDGLEQQLSELKSEYAEVLDAYLSNVSTSSMDTMFGSNVNRFLAKDHNKDNALSDLRGKLEEKQKQRIEQENAWNSTIQVQEKKIEEQAKAMQEMKIQLDATLDKYNNDIAVYEAQLEEAADICVKEMEVFKAQEEIRSKALLNEMEIQVKALKDENQRLLEANITTEAKSAATSEIANKLSNQQVMIHRLELEINVLKDKNNKLEVLNQHLEAVKNEEAAKFKATLSDVQEKLRVAQSEADDLHNKVVLGESLTRNMKKTEAQSASLLADLQETIANNEKQIETKDKLLIDLKATIQKLEASYKTLEKEKMEEIEELKSQSTYFEKMLKKVNAENQQLSKQLESCEVKLTELESSNKSNVLNVSSELTKVKELLKEKEALLEANVKIMHDLNTAKQEVEHNSLQNEMQLKKSREELEGKLRRATICQSDMSIKVIQLEKKVSEMQGIIDGNNHIHDLYTSLQAELVTWKEIVDMKEKKVGELNNEIESYESKLKEAVNNAKSGELESLKNELEGLKIEKDEADKKIVDLQNKLGASNDGKSKLDREIETLNESVHDLQAQLRKAKEESHHSTEKALQAGLHLKNAESSSAHKITELTENIIALQATVAAKEAEISELQTHCRHMEDSLKHSEHGNVGHLTVKIKDQQTVITTQMKEIAALKESNMKLNEAYKQLELSRKHEADEFQKLGDAYLKKLRELDIQSHHMNEELSRLREKEEKEGALISQLEDKVSRQKSLIRKEEKVISDQQQLIEREEKRILDEEASLLRLQENYQKLENHEKAESIELKKMTALVLELTNKISSQQQIIDGLENNFKPFAQSDITADLSSQVSRTVSHLDTKLHSENPSYFYAPHVDEMGRTAVSSGGDNNGNWGVRSPPATMPNTSSLSPMQIMERSVAANYRSTPQIPTAVSSQPQQRSLMVSSSQIDIKRGSTPPKRPASQGEQQGGLEYSEMHKFLRGKVLSKPAIPDSKDLVTLGNTGNQVVSLEGNLGGRGFDSSFSLQISEKSVKPTGSTQDLFGDERKNRRVRPVTSENLSVSAKKIDEIFADKIINRLDAYMQPVRSAQGSNIVHDDKKRGGMVPLMK